MTRPQRVAVLGAAMLTALTVSALFFAESASSINNKLVVATLSALMTL